MNLKEISVIATIVMVSFVLGIAAQRSVTPSPPTQVTTPTPTPEQPEPTPSPTATPEIEIGTVYGRYHLEGTPVRHYGHSSWPRIDHLALLYESLGVLGIDGSGWIVPLKIRIIGNVTIENFYVRSFPLPIGGSREFSVSDYNGSITVWMGRVREDTRDERLWFISNETDPLDTLTLVDFEEPLTFVDKYVGFYLIIPDGTKLLPSGEEITWPITVHLPSKKHGTMASYGLSASNVIYTGTSFSCTIWV